MRHLTQDQRKMHKALFATSLAAFGISPSQTFLKRTLEEKIKLHWSLLQTCSLSWTLVFHTGLPPPKPFKSQILPIEFCLITENFRDFSFWRSGDSRRGRLRRISRAPSQPFQQAGESGDVRLILDTEGERAAENNTAETAE